MKIEQRTPEWFARRLGKATASRIADIIATTKTGPAASRQNYLAELAVERLTQVKAEGFTNSSIQWGIDTEPAARSAYEEEKGLFVLDAEFIDHPAIPMSGASPDGIVNHDGLIEIKCPNTATHIETLLSGSAPKKYIPQMQWQMACTGRQWCDFVSFDPRMPAHLQLFIKRVERDDKLIKQYEEAVIQFLQEVDETVQKLLALKPQ